MHKKHPASKQALVSTPSQAMLHLLLHCCNVDGECSENEMKTIYAIMADLYKVNDEWLAENAAVYYRFRNRITHNASHLQFLVQQINPANPEHLLWHCAQVTVVDGEVSFTEELMLGRLAALLHIRPEICKAVHRLAWQLRNKAKDTP